MVSRTIIATLTELALNKRVQSAASSLVGKVYGKVFSNADDEAVPTASDTDASITVEQLTEQISKLPSSEELATAFAVLQADIDRQHRLTRFILVGILLALGAIFVALIIGSN